MTVVIRVGYLIFASVVCDPVVCTTYGTAFLTAGDLWLLLACLLFPLMHSLLPKSQDFEADLDSNE